MPALIDGAPGAGKRKRLLSKNEPSKRARSEDSEDDAQARILLLENEIFESKKHFNNISTLIQLLGATDGSADDSLVAAIALCRVFTRLLAAGDLTKKHSTSEKEAVVIQWLKERFLEYKTALLLLLSDAASGPTALTLCMRLLKTEGTHILNGQEYSFPTAFLTDIVRNLLHPETSDDLRQEFSEKYVEEYDDVRFYTFESIEYVIQLFQYSI
jgi:U3 small nucleolar RNA-associated protein 19